MSIQDIDSPESAALLPGRLATLWNCGEAGFESVLAPDYLSSSIIEYSLIGGMLPYWAWLGVLANESGPRWSSAGF